LDELQPDTLQFPKDQPVYLLCRSGQRAAKAADKLTRAGYTQPVAGITDFCGMGLLLAKLPWNRKA
jgi:rhodanese-related sulfurtransferase